MDKYLVALIVLALTVLGLELVYGAYKQKRITRNTEEKKMLDVCRRVMRDKGISFKEISVLHDNQIVFVVNDKVAEWSGSYYVAHEDYGRTVVLKDISDYRKEYVLQYEEDLEVIGIRVFKPKEITFV